MLDVFGVPYWTFFGISKMAQEVTDLPPASAQGGTAPQLGDKQRLETRQCGCCVLCVPASDCSRRYWDRKALRCAVI